MKRFLLILALWLSTTMGALGQTATKPTKGDGSQGNPYQIATLENLYWVTKNPISWGKYFKQTADIDAAATSNKSIWATGWLPIGSKSTPFTGSYDGQGFAISWLTIKKESDSNSKLLGLFGKTQEATITRVAVTKADINVMSSSQENVGVLVGHSVSSTISICFVTGSCRFGNNTGGLVGFNEGGTISSCYSYSFSNLACSNGGNAGGLVGKNTGTVTSSFYDKTTSGKSDDDKGTPKTTAEMKDMDTFTKEGWDFTSLWAIGSAVNGGYPTFLTQFTSGESPIVSNVTPSAIIINSAIVRANLTTLGNPAPYEIGFCYSTSSTPPPITSDNNRTQSGKSSPGEFSTFLLNLQPSTTYYVRAYAINAKTRTYCYSPTTTLLTTQAPYLTVPTTTFSAATSGGTLKISVQSNVEWTVFSHSPWIGNLPETTTGSLDVMAAVTGNPFPYSRTGTIVLKESKSSYSLPEITITVTQAASSIPTSSQTPAAGKGTSTEPYQIANLAQLYWIAEKPERWSLHYVQTANIDASATASWFYNQGWPSIGNSDTPFTGSYNGQGHTIANLTANHATEQFVGLFGATNGATIQKLGLLNVSIQGNMITGSLVGDNQGTITNCFSTGSVTGEFKTGGFVGNNKGTIKNCYTTTSVSCGGFSGGFVGYTDAPSLVQYCYSSGGISAKANSFAVGGFVGQVFGGKINSCYWDTQTSGTGNGAGIGYNLTSLKGLTSDDMKKPSSYAGWDLLTETTTSPTYVWSLYSTLNNGLPYLEWQQKQPVIFTQAATNVYATKANANAKLFAFGTEAPKAYGICWNTKVNPTIDDSKIDKGQAKDVGQFTVPLTNLIKDTKYYVRAYATNSAGTSYGKEVSITPTNIKLTIAAPTLGLSKIYDGTTTATIIALGDPLGIGNGDDVKVTATASYDNSNIGNGKTITVTYTLSGTMATSYLAPNSYTVSTGAITPRQLTATAAAVTTAKVYDGNVKTTITNTTENLILGDDVTVTATASYDSKSVGADKTISVSYSLSGSSASSYLAPKSYTISTGKITPKQLIAAATVTTKKVYDGTATTASTTSSTEGIVLGNDVTVASTATYDNPIVGIGKPITVTFSLSGTDAPNYIAPAVTSISNGEITAKPISITPTTSLSKIYGDADPCLTFSASTELLAGNTFTGGLTREAGDVVDIYRVTLGTLSAGDNYAISFTEGTFKINPKPLTISAPTITTKEYNGNNVAVITTVGVVNGIIPGDEVMVIADARFDNANAGAGKTITVSYTLNGSAKTSYLVPQTNTFTNGEITPKSIRVIPNPNQGKTYGGTDPYISYITYPLPYSSLPLMGALSRTSGENAGAYSITMGNLTAGNNYKLTLPEEHFTINPKQLSVLGTTAIAKVYDGTTSATVKAGTASGVLNGDDVSVSATATFVDKNVGNGKTIIIVCTLGGTKSNNYTLAQPAPITTGEISPASLTVTPNNITKRVEQAYSFAGTEFTASGLFDGDELTNATLTSDGAVATAAVGYYSIAAGTAQGTGIGNYIVSYNKGTFTIIDKITPTISWAEPTAITYGTTLGEEQLNATTNAEGTFSYTPAAGTVLDAGQGQTLSVTFTPTDVTNYKKATKTVAISVSKAPLTVTASSHTITKGEAIPTLGVSYSGFINGEGEAVLNAKPTATTTANATSNAGVYDISATGGDDNNYNFNYTTGTLTIGKITPTINWATPGSITYGTPIGNAQLNATASYNGAAVAGKLSYTTDGNTLKPGDILAAGTHNLKVTFTPSDEANHVSMEKAVSLITVNKATLTVTASSHSITKGEIIPTPCISYSGFVNGEDEAVLDTKPTVTTSATDASNANTYDIVAANGNDSNYEFAYLNGTLTISKITPTISWAKPVTITYGTALGNAQLSATASYNGTTVAGTLSYTADGNTLKAGDILAAGVHSLTVTFTPTDATNYRSVEGTVSLIVEKATPTITWETPSSITYGIKLGNEQFGATANIKGTFTYAPALGTTLAAGEYDLKVTFTPSDGDLYISGEKAVSITVAKAPLTATASSYSIREGEAIPALGVTYKGFVNGDTEAVLDTKPTATTTATAASPTGSYTIEVAGSIDANYEFSYVDGKLTISNPIVVDALQAPQPACEGDKLSLAYTLASGRPTEYQLVFYTKALTAGFSNSGYAALPADNSTVSFNIPTRVADGTYQASLQLRDGYGNLSEPAVFQFTVNVSADVIVPKFGNVVLIDNHDARFTGYQWYRNGSAIGGATNQFYKDPNGLSGTYYAQLKTATGQTLNTCSKTLSSKKSAQASVSVYPNPARAGQELTVKLSGFAHEELQGAVLSVYSTQGVPVYSSHKVEQINLLTISGTDGVYMGRIATAEGQVLTFKVILAN